MMTIPQQVITIGLCVLGTMMTRFLPFLIFRSNRPTPRYIQYLGKVLPATVMALLVVYCLKSTTFSAPSGFLPQFIAVAVVAVLHLWKGKTLLSIVGGTVCYMILVQVVFPA